jgi:Domain of unknown function (DUF4062)/SIR2-like domain
MPHKLRVFISSTMEDLANERAAVVNQLRAFNIEPVNAEGLLPTGGTSWDVLVDEIRSSHLFVLILGDSYGWKPTKGYGANSNKSVTHLEADLAKSAGLPVLPFFKILKYKSKTERTLDEDLRDKFRAEIEDWATGFFRAEFRLANDLAQKVRDALLDIFFASYLKERVRSSVATSGPLPPGHGIIAKLELPPLPPQISRGGGVLFAGAGMSLSAGYPTASLLSEHLCRLIGLQGTGEQMLSRHRFAEIAALAKDTIGSEKLRSSVKELLDTPQPIGPTQAHLQAVKLFDVIVTTNYDELFEQACKQQGLDFAVSTSSDKGEKIATEKKAGVMIYKLDGTISGPETLVLTDDDSARVAKNRRFWKHVHDALASKPVAVVGHSLRDTTSRNLLAKRNLDLPGVFVGPGLDPIDEINLRADPGRT